MATALLLEKCPPGIDPLGPDNRLPSRFYEEPVTTGPRRGDVIDQPAFHTAIKTFYAMMGWDAEGVPTEPTLYDAGLEWLLEKR